MMYCRFRGHRLKGVRVVHTGVKYRLKTFSLRKQAELCICHLWLFGSLYWTLDTVLECSPPRLSVFISSRVFIQPNWRLSPISNRLPRFPDYYLHQPQLLWNCSWLHLSVPRWVHMKLKNYVDGSLSFSHTHTLNNILISAESLAACRFKCDF